MPQLKKSHVQINQTLKTMVLNIYYIFFLTKGIVFSIENETGPIYH